MRDFSGFEAWFRANEIRMLRRARSLTTTDADALDLLQTTLLRLAENWPRATRARNVEAYAERVMSNASIDQHRSRARHGRHVVAHSDAADLLDIEATSTGPEEALVSVSAVEEVLGRLPRSQRVIFYLRHVADLRERDVAEALGITVGTVKSQLARSRRHLSEDLHAYTDQETRACP